ncbi:MAG: biotin/lipoyl-binding protein, partial [Acidiferrobacteraceae bacterium]|nr:biotin/lipoyl-binding protein [Acidiferrobacteraceae bacterium]
MRKVLIVIPLAVVIAGGIWLFQGELQDPSPGWRLAQVERGTVEQVVSATGRVDPVMTVDISSQVSGQIAEVLVNFNSKVATGQVLARIDPAAFEVRVEVARADLAYAKANVAMQKAVLDELRAERSGAMAALGELEKDLKRQRILFQRKVVSESVVGSALAQRDQAHARLE